MRPGTFGKFTEVLAEGSVPPDDFPILKGAERVDSMDAIYQPDEIRDLVREAFAALGVPASQLDSLRETVLVRDGVYYGRSYRVRGLMAMWMISVRLIQFYGKNGSMLGSICLGEQANSQRQEVAQRQAA